LAASKARLAQLPKEADGIRQDLIAIATRQGERLKRRRRKRRATLADARCSPSRSVAAPSTAFVPTRERPPRLARVDSQRLTPTINVRSSSSS
jgi:hypothetical protein